MKSCTDLEQSKILAEILPLESADYYHATDAGVVVTTSYITYCGEERCVPAYKGAVPCWSLAALLSVIPNPIIGTHFVTHKWEGESNKVVNHQDGLMEIEQLVSTEGFDNPVDACYKMILKLNKLNLL